MSQVESITIAPTTERKTVPGRFEAALQNATRALASSVVGAVELAAPAVPFGTVLAGAVRGGPRPRSARWASGRGGDAARHGAAARPAPSRPRPEAAARRATSSRRPAPCSRRRRP